jgi:hypothetical protein
MPGEALARKKKKPASRRKGKRSGKKASNKVPPEATETEAEASAGLTESADAAVDEMGADYEAPVIDLDADDIPVIDLDVDEAPDDALEKLIAETLATAGVDDDAPEPDEPVIDLDASLDADIGDAGEAATPDAEAAPNEPVEGSPRATAEAATDQPVIAERSAGGAPQDAEAAEAAIRALIDLGPTSSPEVRDRLLAETLAHAEHHDARYRVPFSQAPTAGRWKALLALVVVLVAGAVATVPPRWARPDPPAQLGPAERASNLRLALLLQAQQVEAFRVRVQRLPASLDEVTQTLPGVRYVRSGSRAYQLIAYEANGNAIVYDSTSPTPPFGTLAPNWAFPP